MTRRGVLAGVAAVLLLGGAEGGGCRGDKEIPVRVVAQGIQCGGSGDFAAVRRIPSAEALAEALKMGPGEPQKLPEIDWSKEAVVLITEGQKPTAGYGVALGSDKAQVKNGAAGVQIVITQPENGMMVAQVVTSPCLVVAFPSEGLRGVGAMKGDLIVARAGL